jgi:phage minor structural protein
MEGKVLVIHILDMKSENIVAILENKEQASLFWNDKHLQQLKDNIETFDFTMQANVPAAEHVMKRNRVIIPDEDGFFREFIIDATQQLSNKTKEVYSSASFSELAKQKILNPVTLNGQTVISAGEYVLQGTEWKLGITEFSGSRTIEFPEHVNALEAIRMIANIFELEVRFRVDIRGNLIIARYVDMIQRVGNVTGKEIVFGKDLIGVTRKEHSADIVTALLGLGPEREDGTRLTVIVEDKEALERWGRNGRHLWDIYTPETSDLDMTLERLTELTKAALKKRVNSAVEYEADAASIEHVLGHSHEMVRLGDTNRLKDTSYSPALYLDARIISVERSISDPSQKKFILGDFIEYKEEDIMKTFKNLKAVLMQKASEQEVQEAQETADKKVQTFFSPTPPTAESIGDLWFNTSTYELKRWDDTDWNIVSDITSQKTAADTASVNGVPAETVEQNASNSVQKGTAYTNGWYWDDKNGVTITRSDGLVRIVESATDGIKIQTRTSTASTWKDKFFVDTSGNIKFVGDMVGGNININSKAKIGNELNIAHGGPRGGGSITFNNLQGSPTVEMAYDPYSNKFFITGASVNVRTLEVEDTIYVDKIETNYLMPAGFCGIGGMNVGTNTSSCVGVVVQFKQSAKVIPSSIDFAPTSTNLGTGQGPFVAEITKYGFWLYLNGNGVNGSYRYWRGEYNYPGGVG